MSFLGISRPARGAGLALLAVAVVAAVIGGITLTSGNGGGEVAEPPPGLSSDQTHPPTDGATSSPGGSTGPSATSSQQAPESSGPESGASSKRTSPTQTGEAGESDTGENEGAGDADKQPRDPDVPVRVYNNSTIDDLASRAAQDLREHGWNVPKVSNYPEGVIPTTTAYYRKGTSEKAAALSLAASFGMQAKPRFGGIEDARQGVIVIVTKDYKGPVGKSG